MKDPEFDEELPKMWDDAYETCDPSGLESEELDHMVHTLTARRLVEAMQSGHGSTISGGTFQAALRFLKDNAITGHAVPGSPQEALRKAMEKRAPFRLTGSDE